MPNLPRYRIHQRPTFLALTAVVVSLLLSGCEAPALPSPTNTVLDELFSSSDDQRALSECLQERGWEAEYMEGGAVEVSVQETQEIEYEADVAACLDEIGVGPNGPLTSEHYDAAYAWYSEITECLHRAGYSVPPTPTRETFESTIETDPWIPWEQLNGDELQRAIEACPVIVYAQDR